jgi:glutathione S-transferase
MNGSIKLVYFNLRGRGELPRLILRAGGQEFDDCPGGVEKSQYEDSLLFGQLPLLIHGEKKIVQSRTITRYLANKLGLSGKTEDEAILCDQLFEGTEDIYEALWPVCAKYRGGSQAALDKALAEGGSVHKYLVMQCIYIYIIDTMCCLLVYRVLKVLMMGCS